MRFNKVKGIILHKYPLNEKDYIVSLFTEEFGKTEAIAKGARRIESKFTGFFEPTNICEFQLYKSRSNFIITECSLITKFDALKTNLKKAIIALDILKLIKKHTYENEETEDNKSLFSLIEESLFELEKTKSPVYLYLGFTIKFLLLQGLIPLSSNKYWKNVSDQTKNLVHYFSNNPLSTVPVENISKNEFHTVIRNLEYFMEY